MLNYNNNYGSVQSIEGGIFTAFIIFFVIIFLIGIAINVLTIIGKWKCFKKAGKNGWEAIVPIYNQIVQCQISGINPWWVLVAFIATLFNAIPVVGPIISLGTGIYFAIILNISTAKSFGKTEGYGIGLWLLPPVFWLILSGSETSYIKENPIDPVYNYVKTKMGTTPSVAPQTQNSTETSFCPNCGTKIDKNIKYCPNCGKEITK